MSSNGNTVGTGEGDESHDDDAMMVPAAVEAEQKDGMDYDADDSNSMETSYGGTAGTMAVGNATSLDDDGFHPGWPTPLNSSGHDSGWGSGGEGKREPAELRRHSLGSAARDSEFGLTVDDRNQLVGNRLAAKIYTNAQQVVAGLKNALRRSEVQLEEQTNTLASVLQQQTSNANSWQQKETGEGTEFENLYHAQLKHNDALTLEMVKLRSQLDEAKRTASNAVAAVGGTPLDTNMGEEDDNAMTDGQESGEGKGGISDIAGLLQDMTRKMQINSAGCEIEAKTVLDFLEKLKEQKLDQQQAIARQLNMISSDMARLEQQIAQLQEKKKLEQMAEEAAFPSAFSLPAGAAASGPNRIPDERPPPVDGRVLGKRVREDEHKEANKRKTKIMSYIDELQDAYFDESTKSSNRLQAFSRHLSTFTKYTYIKTIRTFGYAAHETQVTGTSSLVSSIKLDMNEEFFAVGGLVREIQLFPYNANEIDAATSIITEELAPVQVMKTDHNIASTAWSHHSRGQLAAADYAGVVTLWDCHSSTLLTTFRGHEKEKRVWGVDYSSTMPGMLASASEDCCVKLWDVAQQRSTVTIPSNAAICSVKFHPMEHKVAFGTSASKVFLYDLRKTEDPVAIFHGHQKPVCGVDFLNGEEMVSQAVDSSLKLWKVANPREAIRTFHGHHNAKRFTGLTARNEFIMCGSEDNAVVVYNKMINTPFLRDSFNTGATFGACDDESFASSVCFNKHANVILAGNSKGIIKIMKLE
eukprot:CAMPEP_0114613454 /NCGR_PEP_ID=MMETSP0168-20121206/5140_1 /TAXON_ID=95228 ORGANISM="Vannella sp., Strain DIVA3 517/6/12" /NCGR_SAMPLE_ID=MMETSP0168 /ASSEMBLY_ACC=CAM_ASM_000044 /LENGTH=753 /DNA_ID=CAMNT_0001824459 /DNA_START=125 /DNA_END=2386 /DNA_ORIENTATION=-